MSSHESATEQKPDELKEIREALAELQFGEVTVVGAGRVVVQVKRTEQVRLSKRSKR